MNQQNLIGLIDALKQSRDSLRNNQNLGFLVKSAMITSISVSIIMSIWMIMYFASIFFTISKVATGDKYKKAVNSATYTDYAMDNSTIDPFGDLPKYNYNDMVAEPNPNYKRIPTQPKANVTPMPTTPDKGVLAVLAGVWIIILILAALYGTFTSVVNIKTALDISQNSPEAIKPLLKASLKITPKMLVLVTLKTLIIGIGYILFIIPGIILQIKFMFAEIIMIQENKGIMDSMKTSMDIVKGYKLNLYLKQLGLMFLGAFVVAPIMWFLFYPMGMLLSFATYALYRLVAINIYNDLKRIKTTQVVVPLA